jgi:hypothetical protein
VAAILRSRSVSNPATLHGLTRAAGPESRLERGGCDPSLALSLESRHATASLEPKAREAGLREVATTPELVPETGGGSGGIIKGMKAFCIALLLIGSATPGLAQPERRHVVVITIDGLRSQEFFGGADEAYFKRDPKGVIDPVSKRYAGDTPEIRRAILMPFLWSVVAKQGQIFGDPSQRSRAHVTNGLWFSYPGYNEMLAGAADPRVDSNNKTPNPNVTVLEWLDHQPGFASRVAAFGSWDVLPYILNTERSHLRVGSGFVPVPDPSTPREREVNEVAADLPRYWDYGTFDAPFVYAAIEALRSLKPRVLYVMLGEGDEWAHEGRYDLYVDATRRADRFIERIWMTLQSLPDYRDQTTLLVTTDHGRGATVRD